MKKKTKDFLLVLQSYALKGVLGIGSLALAIFSYIIVRDKNKITKLENKQKELEVENIEVKTENEVNATPLPDLINEHNREIRKRKTSRRDNPGNAV